MRVPSMYLRLRDARFSLTMKRVEKDDAKLAALTGLPLEFLALDPTSENVLGDFMGHMVCPPNIEQELAPAHRERVGQLRTELKSRLAVLPPYNGPEPEVNAPASKLCSEYLGKLYALCGQEAYNAAVRKTAHRKTLQDNLVQYGKASEKAREYRERSCARCGRCGPWKQCSGCRAVHYCTAGCQKSDWSSHKQQCRR